MSRAEARKRVLEAKGGKVAKISNAIAQSGQFTNQIAAYLASPSVYKQRTYLATLVESMAGARKYILGTTNNNDSYWINLEDKFSTDLLDIKMSPKSKEISEEESK